MMALKTTAPKKLAGKKTKADFLLLIALLCLICLGFLIRGLLVSKPGKRVLVRCQNKVLGEYPLEADQTIPIPNQAQPTNILVIKDGCAYMKSAQCPDHLCIKQGRIHLVHQSIVCLPNQVSVEITGEENETEQSYDTFTN